MGSVQIKGGQIVDSDRDWETVLDNFFHDDEEIIGC